MGILEFFDQYKCTKNEKEHLLDYLCTIRVKRVIKEINDLKIWKSHSTLTLLATQDLPTFLYYMIDPLKSWCWGAILFYPFKNSRFS